MKLTTTSLQVKHTKDDNSDTWQPLTRTEIRKLKLAAMREELAKRGLDTSGTRPVLMTRLLDTVDRASPSKRNSAPKEETSNDTCPPLNHDTTYVLRVKGHSKLAYNSSGIGLVLYDADNVREIWAARKYFSPSFTPFETDYKASIIGLEHAYRHGARKLILQSDNNVIVKQVTGEYEVKKPNLKKLCSELQAVIAKIPDFEMIHISAADNNRAKNLAQRAVATQKTIGLPEDDEEDSEEEPSTIDKQQVLDSIPESLHVNGDSGDEDLFPFSDAEEDDEATHTISPDKTYLLQFDGGARGNPGIAGSGMVLYDPGTMEELWCGWKFMGENTTNNAAEYSALLLGIQCARSLGVQKLRVEGDSLLAVNQVTGKWKAREPSLKKYLQAVLEAAEHLEHFEIQHIDRKSNKRADQLANIAMDSRDSFGFDELD